VIRAETDKIVEEVRQDLREEKVPTEIVREAPDQFRIRGIAYYRMSGVNATIAMLLNLLILLGMMAWLQAALTLPGIAGIVLTIGVGIDSNVLIFERIKEELSLGKSPSSAIALGFQRVFRTLIDTHLAATVSAAILFMFGTSAVRGFAVTLAMGLISNMFTSVFVSRTLFDCLSTRKGPVSI
jgi:preprotein translocase subunit SecD